MPVEILPFPAFSSATIRDRKIKHAADSYFLQSLEAHSSTFVLSFGAEEGRIQEAEKLRGVLQLWAGDSSLGCVQVLRGSEQRKSFLRSPRTCGAAHSWGPGRRAGSAVAGVPARRHGRCSAGRGAGTPRRAVGPVLAAPYLQEE